MNDRKKIIFIGGLSNGKIVYDYLQKNKFVDLKLTITYPDDFTKERHQQFESKDNVIKTKSANEHIKLIQSLNPDYIFVSGWSELLSDELINLPINGTIGFHPAKLPKDRGRSVIAWQIEEGYTESALTMFYYNSIPDGGDIIAQEIIKIDFTDYINDVLDKFDKATYDLMRAYFPLIRQGKAPRRKQDINEGNFRRLRTDIDSMIDWDRPSIEIYNKIRAISKPYPGAICILEGVKYRIWESIVINDFNFGINEKPGTIIAKLFDHCFIVKTRDSFIKVTKYTEDNGLLC